MHEESVAMRWTPTERRMVRLVREFEESGLGSGAFARSQGMTPARFSWWKSHLKRRQRRAESEAGAFVEARIAAEVDAPSPGLVLDLGHGRRLEIGPGFDVDTLRRVVQAVASC